MMYMTSPDYDKYLIEKQNEQKKSFNFLNTQNINLNDCYIIFLNKSKYSHSSELFMNDIKKYTNSNIAIFYMHLNDIKEFIKPLILDTLSIDHLNIVLENFNSSNYSKVTKDDIIKFIKKNNYQNDYFIYF